MPIIDDGVAETELSHIIDNGTTERLTNTRGLIFTVWQFSSSELENLPIGMPSFSAAWS